MSQVIRGEFGSILRSQVFAVALFLCQSSCSVCSDRASYGSARTSTQLKVGDTEEDASYTEMETFTVSTL